MFSPDIKSSASSVKWFYLAIATLVLWIYAAFFNANFSWDAIIYALQIENDYNSNLLHPHHLLFHTVSWVWYRLGKVLFFWGAMESVQWLNAIAGTAGVLLVFQIISDRIGSLTVATLLSLSVAFSYSYWFYSIEHETYILPLIFILFALFILSRYTLTFVSVAWAAIAVGMATLLHQSHILMIVAITFHIISNVNGVRRMHYVLFFLTLSGLLIVIPHLLAAYITGNLTDLTSLFYWITAYAHSGQWESVSWINVPYAVVGFLRAFFFFDHLHNSVITGQFSTLSGLTIVLVLLYLGSFTVICVRSRKSMLKNRARKLSLLRLCIVIGIVYAGFAMYWEPHNSEFWVPITVPVVIIFGLLMHWDPMNCRLLMCLVLLLFVVNFMDKIYPDSQL